MVDCPDREKPKLKKGAEMSADALLSQLDCVRKTGQVRWSARCPAHKDRTASLSIRELDDGQVLVHCFAGCSVHDVLSATGLDINALFPEKLTHHRTSVRRSFPAIDAIRAISFESLIVLVCAGDMLAGKFSKGDRERLGIAIERIQSALTACGVNYGR